MSHTIVILTFLLVLQCLEPSWTLSHVPRWNHQLPVRLKEVLSEASKHFTSSSHPSNIFIDKNSDTLQANIQVTGDPTVDKKVILKVRTSNHSLNLNLQRINDSILHDDVRILSVYTDGSGKTVFDENTRPHFLHQKAKEMNFYHDIHTGTLVDIRHHGFHPNGNPKHIVEGVLNSDLMIAPPTAQMRHKRALRSVKHTVWTKDVEFGTFEDDELFVPAVLDKMKPTPTGEVPYSVRLQAELGTDLKSKHRRSKRQYSPVKIDPELLLFVDNAMVHQFEGNTEDLLEYLLHFWHAVNWKFLTISLQRKWPLIDLKIREIGVFRDKTAQPFIEENRIREGSKLFSLYDAMDSLQRWLVKYESVLPLHDIAFLQTGNDACRMSSHTRRFRHSRFTSDEEEEEVDGCVAGTAGVAYVRGACLSAPYFRKFAYNFGIGEASTSFNGVIIAAHEVGHLLGAYHDGEAEAASCPSNSGYIMSYSREDAYKFSRFSSCSIRSFQNFLRMDRAQCLRQRGSSETMQFPTSFPGSYMSIREQCRRFTGGPPCEIGAKQCEHLCCDDAKGQWRYTRSEPAVDGTSCGNKSICLNGQCVSLSSFGK